MLMTLKSISPLASSNFSRHSKLLSKFWFLL